MWSPRRGEVRAHARRFAGLGLLVALSFGSPSAFADEAAQPGHQDGSGGSDSSDCEKGLISCFVDWQGHGRIKQPQRPDKLRTPSRDNVERAKAPGIEFWIRSWIRDEG